LKTYSLTKFSFGLLLASLPLNFIVIEGLGSIYLSTVIIFFNWLIVCILSKGAMLKKKATILSILIYLFIFFTTLLNILFDDLDMLKDQFVFSVIHLQILLVFNLSIYYVDYLNKLFAYQWIIIFILLFSTRIFIDDWDNAFNLSSVRGFRVETIFAGGVNNFGLIVGLGFIISFFHLKKSILKVLACLYFIVVIILTMSRGALFGLVITLFLVALYDTKGKILSSLLKTSFCLTFIGCLLLLYSNTAQDLALQFSERFLSIFSGEATIEQASSGRGLIVRDIYNNHIKNSSLFEILFGHGMGSINFMVNGSPYESSHNFIVDVFYRNGILILFGYLVLVIYLCYMFIKNRKGANLTLFGIFVFLHFEILVNPFVYAAQTGWIYGLFLAIFLNQKKFGHYKRNEIILE
jgi:hypothetical protein